jgi:D-alanine--poly(phosphoribitol) ligase subunit 1
MASALVHLHIKQGDIVLIATQKSFESLSLWLACIRLGIVYVHLDIQSPVQRLRYIVEKTQPTGFFLDTDIPEACVEAAQGFDTYTLSSLISEDCPLLSESELAELSQKVTSDSPLYIMFTSGSTGQPKGAIITHQNGLNFIQWAAETYQFAENERLSQINPLYFDNSVFDLFASLFNGLSLAIITHLEIKEPLSLISKLEKMEVTSWFSVPSLLIFLVNMRAFTKERLPGLKRFLFGGEGYPKDKLNVLFSLFSDRVEFYNVYGPTECTCICSSHRIENHDFSTEKNLITLGKLASNFSYVLRYENEYRIPKKGESTIGELVLCGPNVGQGYIFDDEKTSCMFISIPVGKWSQRAYLTGDLVEVDENGNLHFLGRSDNQIKWMGYRIEVEEVELALNKLDCIRESCVFLKQDSFGNPQLSALVATSTELDKQQVLSSVKQYLPAYMIPKSLDFCEHLPKNANGKIDRQRIKEQYS